MGSSIKENKHAVIDTSLDDLKQGRVNNRQLGISVFDFVIHKTTNHIYLQHTHALWVYCIRLNLDEFVSIMNTFHMTIVDQIQKHGIFTEGYVK